MLKIAGTILAFVAMFFVIERMSGQSTVHFVMAAMLGVVVANQARNETRLKALEARGLSEPLK